MLSVARCNNHNRNRYKILTFYNSTIVNNIKRRSFWYGSKGILYNFIYYIVIMIIIIIRINDIMISR